MDEPPPPPAEPAHLEPAWGAEYDRMLAAPVAQKSARRPAPASAGPKRVIGAGTREGRLRREEQARIEAENLRNKKKLAAIKREPPRAYHAPLGPASLKQAPGAGGSRAPRPHSAAAAAPPVRDQVGLCANSTMRLAPSVWPLPANKHTQSHQAWRATQAGLAQGNLKLQEHLEVMYRQRVDFVAESGKPPAKSLDLREAYRRRTALYDAEGPGTAPSTATDTTGVPRTQAVAQCAGCGRKSFWAADGKALTPCHECGAALYCSHACAVLDWESHKQLCAYATTGQFKPSRPMAEYWIGAPGMAAERELLRNQTRLWPAGGATDGIAAKGKEADAAWEAKHARKLEALARRDLYERSSKLAI